MTRALLEANNKVSHVEEKGPEDYRRRVDGVTEPASEYLTAYSEKTKTDYQLSLSPTLCRDGTAVSDRLLGHLSCSIHHLLLQTSCPLTRTDRSPAAPRLIL
ncbi:hypothetical protein J6590_014094 [Homalodisca vitripennis]|nr:hypothetical protein J6590_014094 [Homalodisca vitripennis]